MVGDDDRHFGSVNPGLLARFGHGAGFGVHLGWLPVASRGTAAHLMLPALSLGLFNVAYNARMMRSCMLEVLSEGYIRTACRLHSHNHFGRHQRFLGVGLWILWRPA